MQVFRCVYRIPLLVLLVLAACVAMPVARVLLHRLPGTWTLFRRTFLRLWGRNIARILGMQIDVERISPEAPYLLVGNHLSYIDIILLVSQLDAIFVARHDLAQWPVFGPLARVIDTIFVQRANRLDTVRVNRKIREALESGRGVVLFPEGWVSDGQSVREFHPPLLDPAVRLQLPVHYFSIHYETPMESAPASESVCWDSETSLYPHLLDLVKQPGFRARLTFGPEPVFAEDRKSLALRLHEAVRAQFTKIA